MKKIFLVFILVAALVIFKDLKGNKPETKSFRLDRADAKTQIIIKNIQEHPDKSLKLDKYE